MAKTKVKTKQTGPEKIHASLKALVMPIDAVKPDERNARKHGERNIESIKDSLQRFGQRQPIVANSKSKVVVAGNARLLAAREMGWQRIAVLLVNESQKESRAFGLADNRTAELAQWDDAQLAELLGELDREDQLSLGWSVEELESLLGAAMREGLTDDDAVPEPPDKAITQLGDLWILPACRSLGAGRGDHRLLCGDSASSEDVDRLLDGNAVQLVNTDPPYNVRVEPRSNNAIAAGNSSFALQKSQHLTQSVDSQRAEKRALMHHQSFDVARQGMKHATTRKLRPKDRPLENDFVSDDDFAAMLRAWFGNIARVLEPGRAAYIWGGYANCKNYPAALEECGLYFSQAIIWVKEHPVLTRKDFMGNHEWCFYCWREGAAHYFNPEITNATDVWSVKKVNPQNMIHLTEKPVELAVRAMTYSSRPGENVLDLFGGSGSTLIAAEKTGRRAYLMEIDALYCDVIVRRWEEFTGRKARRVAAEANE